MTATNESLATAFQRCRQSFEAVLTLCIDIENSSRDAWEDEASRLRLWGANIGAAQTKSSTSLDFRLRDADTVRLQIHKNLSNLDEALNEAVVCLGELAQPYTFDRNAKPSEESMQSQTSSKTLSHREGASVESQEHDDSSASDNGASVEDLQAAFDDVVSLINSLFRMTLYIQNPSRRDQLKHRDTSAVANFETFDVSHVENKFPKAVGSLTQRLGQANTVRRANLKYWERHHKKLAFDESVNDAATIAPLSESVATAFQPVQVEEDQTDTRSHFSGTSYMESLLGGESIRRPDLPEEGRKGTPFQCPICCYIVTVFGQREWMKHVFFDLQPYVCVFEDCKTPLLLYENRRDWFSHVTNNHIPRDASNPLLQHLQCPLCRDSIRSLPSIRRHLARHLEEVALFSLPNSLFGEETEMVDDDKPADYSSEEEAITEDVVSKREGLSGLQMWERVDVSHDDLDKVAIDSLLGESSSRGLDRPRVEEQPEERRVSPDPQEMHRPRKDGNGNHSPVSSSDDEFVVVEEGGSTMFSQESDEGPLKGGPDDAYGKEAGLSLSRPGDESETRIRSSRPRDLKKDLWTEITKDLVEEEAIRQMGYDFEETDHFYYILQYLQYVSDAIRRWSSS